MTTDIEVSTEARAAEGGASPTPMPAVYPDLIDPDLIDSDALKVLRRLTRNRHQAYLVGGGVRDLLLGRRPKDFDIATSARPNQVRDLFRNCRVIGRRFRLAHVMFGGGKIIEVATFRRDPGQVLDDDGRDDDMGRSSDGIDLLIRHDNVFGEPDEDARRRDFTINGLFYDAEQEEVIDYVGGWPDLERRVVATIGDPDVRLREDPVRLLRAIKFSARLDLGIESRLYDAITTHRGELRRAARPRVFEEILRLLRGGAAHRSVYLLWDTGVLAEILPELAAFLDDDAPGSADLFRRLGALDERVADQRLPNDAILLAALLYDPIAEWVDDARDPAVAFEDFFEDLGERLAVPRRLKDRIRAIVVSQRRLRSGKLGSLPRREFFADAATLFALDAEGRGEAVPAWAERPEVAAVEVDPGRRRRRRRHR